MDQTYLPAIRSSIVCTEKRKKHRVLNTWRRHIKSFWSMYAVLCSLVYLFSELIQITAVSLKPDRRSLSAGLRYCYYREKRGRARQTPMHSLQKLRAENAAERLSQASDLSEAPPVSEAVTTTVGAPRVGRTLAPLTSTGSPLPAANEGENRNTSGGAEEDTTRQEDREARRQRRKYRQEREQQRNEGDNGGNDDTATSVATPASTVGKDKASIHFPGEGVIQKSAPDQTNGVRVDLNRERADTEATGGRTRAPLAARRAPPQEKPRKNLTPSAARRARIDQQKRQEVILCYASKVDHF